jgi:hypothetical protein
MVRTAVKFQRERICFAVSFNADRGVLSYEPNLALTPVVLLLNCSLDFLNLANQLAFFSVDR